MEQPDCKFWKEAPFVRRTLTEPDWFIKYADHCSNRRSSDLIFSRKRTTWLLYNTLKEVPLRMCNKDCDCLIPGTNLHQKVICWREDLHKDQVVMTDPVDKARIPYGIFDVIQNSVQSPHRINTSRKAQNQIVPYDLLNQIMVSTGSATGYFATRCNAIHNKTLRELKDANFTYTKPNQPDVLHKYSKSDLRYDITHGYVHIKKLKPQDGLTNAQRKEQDSALNAEILENSNSLAFMHTGADPLNEAEADRSPFSAEWHKAKWIELDGLRDNNTWTYVDAAQVPTDEKIYRGKFCFTLKPAQNNMPPRYKARWVISDPKWTQRIADGYDTFSPTVRLATLRMTMSQLVQRNWQMIEVDIANAFVTSRLPKPVYMKMPAVIANLPLFDASSVGQSIRVDNGDVYFNNVKREVTWQSPTNTLQNFIPKGNFKIAEVDANIGGTVELSNGAKFKNTALHVNKVCRVSAALYGLSYSPRAFHNHLNGWFEQNGYTQSPADSCLWLKYDKSGKLVGSLIEWVDDIIACGEDDFIQDFRTRINKSFKIRDYGNPTDFVGMQINHDRDKGTLCMYQEKYIDKIAKRYGINEETDERDIHSPIASTSKILPSETDDKRADSYEFRSIIGALHFCAHACRPEISAPVTILSRHMIDPSIQHLKQARRILSYLHKTKRLGLTFRRDHTTTITPEISLPPGTLTGFADATWADDPMSRKSHTGYAYLINGAAISWASKQQHEIANSSSEAEFRAYNACGREGLFLRKLMLDFTDRAQTDKPQDATIIYSDSVTAIKWLKNKSHHAATKHIDTATLSIRQHVMEFNNLNVKYIRTSDQIADVLTKPLDHMLHWRHTRRLLGIKYDLSQTASSRTSLEGG